MRNRKIPTKAGFHIWERVRFIYTSSVELLRDLLFSRTPQPAFLITMPLIGCAALLASRAHFFYFQVWEIPLSMLKPL